MKKTQPGVFRAPQYGFHPGRNDGVRRILRDPNTFSKSHLLEIAKLMKEPVRQ